jgi:hypothetical protein
MTKRRTLPLLLLLTFPACGVTPSAPTGPSPAVFPAFAGQN